MTNRDRKIARFNARIAATTRRLAQEKQDPSKTMMGQWSEADRRDAAAMIEQVQGVVDGLATYTKTVRPDSISQIGQLVQFVSSVKPAVSKLVTLLKNFS